MDKLDILVLSGFPRMWSARLADDMILALEKAGHHVDFNYPEFDDDLKHARESAEPSLLTRLLIKFRIVKILNKFGYVFPFQGKQIITNKVNHDFYNVDESHPLLNPKLVLQRLKCKHYDMIIFLFWVNVFDSTTMKVLYDHFKCPIFNYAVDMAPMTGGCFYFGDCRRFENECKGCLSWNGLFRNQAHHNFCVKQKNYDSIEICTATNTWGKRFVEGSNLFKHISVGSIIINDKTFYPKDKASCFLSRMISDKKKFVMLARYTGTETRKGYDYLVKSLNIFCSKITKKEKDSVMLILIGREIVRPEHKVDVDTIQLGFVDAPTLADAYAFSNVFLCPSTDDGGPSMVNQSIMCGTPVVAFDSGTAIDVVQNGVSGYRVPLRDTESFANAINKLFHTSTENFKKMRESTRKIALEWNSPSAFVHQVENVYRLFRG